MEINLAKYMKFSINENDSEKEKRRAHVGRFLLAATLIGLSAVLFGAFTSFIVLLSIMAISWGNTPNIATKIVNSGPPNLLRVSLLLLHVFSMVAIGIVFLTWCLEPSGFLTGFEMIVFLGSFTYMVLGILSFLFNYYIEAGGND